MEEQGECLPMPALVGDPVLENLSCVVRASLPKGLGQAVEGKSQIDALFRENGAVPQAEKLACFRYGTWSWVINPMAWWHVITQCGYIGGMS